MVNAAEPLVLACGPLVLPSPPAGGVWVAGVRKPARPLLSPCFCARGGSGSSDVAGIPRRRPVVGSVAAEPCLRASLCGAPGVVQVVPQVPEAEWWCCSCPPSALSRVSLLRLPLAAACAPWESWGGRGGKRRRHVCASPRLEGGCRCRAVVPTCVWGIGLVGACLRACHPAPVGWCVPGVLSGRGVVRSGWTSAGAGRAVANGIGNAPSLPLPWPRMLEVPFLPYTADPLARLIGLSGGAPSACLLPARRGGGGSWGGVWPTFGEECLL